MVIGSVDSELTKKIKKKNDRKIQEDLKRKRYEEMKESKRLKNDLQISDESGDDSSVLSYDEDEGDIDSDVPILPSRSPSIPKLQARINLTNLASACDRTGVSDRSASILVSSLLQDIGVVSKLDSSKVIDRSKIRRERQKLRQNLQCKIENITGLYFDGRKDKTMILETIGARTHRKISVEEHIVLVSEPEGQYLGHVTPSCGNAKTISSSIIDFVKNILCVNMEEITAVGCDGTIVNTGSKNGIVCQLEAAIGKPVHWFICLLHLNELPLRHLMAHVDGKTNDPKGFSGVLGKALESCDSLPIQGFEKIMVELPPITIEHLSTDQKYLYEMCEAVSNGNVDLELANRQPGRMSHSRWLTTANRILRLYVGTEKPSKELLVLATYIIKVYVFVWFQIKTKPSCLDGPKHILALIKASKYLPKNLKAIVHPVIERNAYFCHPENILLAMLADSRSHVRELGLRRILKSRADIQVKITEPPLTRKISDDDLRAMVQNVPENIELSKYPCHTQAVERCIKLVTEASASVCGQESRDGFIKARISSRKLLPKFETKKEFAKALEK
ncbi:uncharacterized protein LOC129953593 [Eupeodes corollae]|uniref:uncharacterized protein LOC129953593 n=1 Tax=Eupeodes corollae TaxID=290404 RepID=UPI002492FE97|nr:uncharacterized protein LOC129953593 [Eupeodes corollae]